MANCAEAIQRYYMPAVIQEKPLWLRAAWLGSKHSLFQGVTLVSKPLKVFLSVAAFASVIYCWYSYWRVFPTNANSEIFEEGVVVPVQPFQPSPVWQDEQRAVQMVPSELLGHLRMHATFTARDVKVAQELKLKAKAWCDKTRMSEAEKAAIIPRAVAAAMSPSEAEVAAHAYMGGHVANKGIWAANAFVKSGTLACGGKIPQV